MKKVLTLVEYYLPGFKAGGPIKAVSSLVAKLGDTCCFQIITKDRDAGDVLPYPQITLRTWQKVGKGTVYYLSSGLSGLLALCQLLRKTPHDILYLNSLFCPRFTICPLFLHRLGLLKLKKIVLAPRGELCNGALELKTFKKILFIKFAQVLGLFNGITWQASSCYEEQEIIKTFGKNTKIVIAPELLEQNSEIPRNYPKEKGKINIAFLSRIHPTKNLLYALEILSKLKGNVSLDIYGPISDKDYWNQCQTTAKKLSSSIKITYKGPVNSSEVIHILAQYDLFFLPTLGENYGYVIIESLLAGCPVLISDQTPWQELEKFAAGVCVSLDQPEKFKQALQRYLEMDEADHQKCRQNAYSYAIKKTTSQDDVAQNLSLFC